MGELSRRGVRDYSALSFGEGLSRIARHEITLLCIKCIHKELSKNPKRGKGRGRGRPHSAMGLLAIRMGVHIDTIKRWADISQPQACDFNTTKLAEIAYKCDPQRLVRIINQDLDRRQKTIEKWFKEVESNYPAPPYVVNRPPHPYYKETLPDEDVEKV